VADEKSRTPKGGVGAAVRAAVGQFEELTSFSGAAPTGVRRDGDGWSVLVDVVEIERVPSTASVMATYRVDLDESGDLAGYERLRRYNRGAVDPT